MISDSISFLEVNGLNNEIFLEIKRIRYLWRQRSVTNSIFKEITKIERYQRITDFLQDHIKSINSLQSRKLYIKSTGIKILIKEIQNRRFLVFPNDFPPASIGTLINEKTPSIDFTQLNTPKNHKPIHNKKGQTNQRNRKSYRHNSINL